MPQTTQSFLDGQANTSVGGASTAPMCGCSAQVNGDPGTSHSLGRYLAEPATIAAIAHTDATSKDRETTLRTVMDQVEQKVGVIPEGMSSWNGMTDELELLEKAGKGDQSTARKE